MESIVIKVWRGCVEAVYSTTKNIDVEVLDLDVPDEENLDLEIELPHHKVY